MKKIISLFLMLAVCFMLTAYAEEQEIFSSVEPMGENADVLLDFENLNDSSELSEQAVAEVNNIETFNTNEISELTEDDNIMLYAESSVVASGECGENGNNLTWQLDSNGTLTISGSGNLANYRSNGDVPWNGYANQISRVSLDITTEMLCPTGNCCAFGMLYKVNEIEIPEGVSEIPQSDKLFPSNLRKLILPSTYTGKLSNNNLIRTMCYLDIEIAENNPIYCSVDGTLFNKDRTKLIQYTRSAIEPNYVIPETVTDIDKAFYGNSALKTLTITKNVEIVNNDTYNNKFWDWGLGMDVSNTKCTAVYVDEENPYYCSVDGVLYNKDMTILIWCPPYKTGETFIIPDTVKIIAAGAFSHSRYSSIQIPNGVELLGSNAFSASKLTSITIPESVNRIYMACFFCCNSLSKVYIEADETAHYAHQIFDGCAKLKTAGAMGSGCDIEFCWTTTIPSYTFDYCSNITEVKIPSTVTSIGYSAFGNCIGLKEIIIPENVTFIAGDAFYNCTGLTEITIPHSVTTIEDYAFDSCTALSDIYIDKVEGTLAGTPWAAPSATITYLREINIAPFPKSHMYTGCAITPSISITDDRKDGTASTTLIEDKDYTLTYSNNTNAGTAEITVSYINDYVKLSDDELKFTIIPRVSNKLIIAPISDQMYTSRAITPNPTITDNN